MSDDQPPVHQWTTVPFPGAADSPPSSVDVTVEVGAHSRRGQQRASGVDHYAILRLGRLQETLATSLPADALPSHFEESGYGLMVAKGLGAGGEAASRLAISTLTHLAVTFGRWNVRISEPIADEVMDRAERFYRSIDTTLLRASQGRPDTLQSALTAIYTSEDELFFAHVGRSRAYLLRDGELMQLTRDHSVAGGDADRGIVVNMINRERTPRRVVSETLGSKACGSATIDVERLGLLDGDLVLLCTDGLSDLVDEARVADVLRRFVTGSPDDLCRTLVALASGSGGGDDVTVLAARFHIRDKPRPVRDVADGR